jgi:mRNA-degrading endonuclease YafQ of YafQ-DinJ toxin-antitoxin module
LQLNGKALDALTAPGAGSMGNQMSFVEAMFAHAGLSAVPYTSVFGRQFEALTKRNLINPFALMEEIGKLERNLPSRTKKAEHFKKGLLAGLMHKHFFNARHIPQNILNHWLPGSDRMHRAVKKVLGEYADKPHNDWDLAGKLSERLVAEAFVQRENRHGLTGDWIVYKRHVHKNYYLCLAGHEERDEDIFERLSAAAELEFPELGIRRDGV